MSKMIFSDLDGTLLCSDKSISPKNKWTIEEALRQGHSFVIATGRPFESALQISDMLGLNQQGCYIVSYNGAHIYDCYAKKVIYSNQLSMDIVHELFAFAKESGLYIHTYQNGQILTEKNSEELEWYASRTNLEPAPRADVLKVLTREPNKAIVINIHDHNRLEQFRLAHLDWAVGKVSFQYSNPMYLEIVSEGVSKKNGILFLAEKMGVDVKDTIAIGDESNDDEMIKAAGIGVAMCNGNPATKAVADYVTVHNNNEDGIAEVIEKFVLRGSSDQ